MLFRKKKPSLASEVLEELEHTERELLVQEAMRERADHMVNLYAERCARLRTWLTERVPNGEHNLTIKNERTELHVAIDKTDDNA